MSEKKNLYDIDVSRTAMLVIDAQRVYADPQSPLCVSDFSGTIANINDLAAACRGNSIPVFVIKHVYDPNERDVGRLGDFGLQGLWKKGTDFAELDPRLTTAESDIQFEKTRFSSFTNTPLESYLKSMNVDTVIVTGFMTQYCSVTAARHAHDLDYRVIFVSDANDGPSLPDTGFGAVPIEDVKRVIHTTLSIGVAEILETREVVNRIVRQEVRAVGGAAG